MNRRRFALLALAGLATAGASAQSPDPAPTARTRTIVGELVRVDLRRRLVTLKGTDREPREWDIAVDDATRLVSAGRALRLEDVRPGDKAVAVCVEDGPARLRASTLKLGPSSYAAPTPGPSKKP